MCRNWTLAQAKQYLKTMDMTITKRDDEYRVNHANGKEGTAYYTNDMHDAVCTAEYMFEERLALTEEKLPLAAEKMWA